MLALKQELGQELELELALAQEPELVLALALARGWDLGQKLE